MGTWIVSIKTSAGESIWHEENRNLGDTVFDLWQRDETLHHRRASLLARSRGRISDHSHGLLKPFRTISVIARPTAPSLVPLVTGLTR